MPTLREYAAWMISLSGVETQVLAALVFCSKLSKLSYVETRPNEAVIGTGLFILTSFMNHDDEPNTCRKFIQDFIFVFAQQPICANTELTTFYSEDIKHWLT